MPTSGGRGAHLVLVDVTYVGDGVHDHAHDSLLLVALDGEHEHDGRLGIGDLIERELTAQVDDGHDHAADVDHTAHMPRCVGQARGLGPRLDLLHSLDVDAVLLAVEDEGQPLSAIGECITFQIVGYARLAHRPRLPSGLGQLRFCLRVDHSADVHDQRDRSVSEDGRAGNAVDLLVIVQVLDHDLAVAQQFIH